jgi:hypothetical protein
MRHLARPVTALFALWFAVMLGDPGMLHTCAMHGGHGGHDGSAAYAAPAAAGHDMQAAHGAHGIHGARGTYGAQATHGAQGTHGATHATAPGDTQEPPAPRTCTCLGHCCAVTVTAPLPAVATLPVPVAVAEERHPLDAPAVEAPAAPDRRLPFANGPPTV